MDYVFAIPSYKRHDNQRFLKYLSSLGYTKDDIFVSTQTEEDYKTYSRVCKNYAQVIYRAGHNVCDNKNTLLDNIKDKRIVMVSDKVESIGLLSNDGLRTIDKRSELDSIISWCYGITNKLGADVFGVYPVRNAFFMSRSLNVQQMLLGCFMGFNQNTKYRFDPSFPLKEDFELSLRIIADGHKVVRFNNICLKETFHQNGGCKEFWTSKGDIVNHECTQNIIALYPSLVEPHRTRKNELRFIGNSKKINF